MKLLDALITIRLPVHKPPFWLHNRYFLKKVCCNRKTGPTFLSVSLIVMYKYLNQGHHTFFQNPDQGLRHFGKSIELFITLNPLIVTFVISVISVMLWVNIHFIPSLLKIIKQRRTSAICFDFESPPTKL